MTTKILVTPRSFGHYKDEIYPVFEEAGYEIVENELGRTFTEDEMMDACTQVEGVIVGLDPITSRVLKASPNLRAISKYGSGLDNIDIVKADELGVQVMSAVGANSTSVAELAVAFLFALSRNVFQDISQVKQGSWKRSMGSEIAGKTLGVIGCGQIGRKVIEFVRGLRMNVLINDDWFDDNNFLEAHGAQQVDFQTILQKSDFVTLHCPLTPETKELMDEVAFNQMKQDAYLINVSRGEIVDENALYNALSNGIIAGAAQDVFSVEPPPMGHPLLGLPNFLLTPHVGGYTREAVKRMATMSAENLLTMLAHSNRRSE